MTRHRDDVDLDGMLHTVRDNLGKADAYITAAENLIEQPGGDNDRTDGDDDDEPGRHRNHVAHLVESAKLAVRAAICAGGQVAAEFDRRRGESVRTVALAIVPGKPRGRT